MGCDAVATGWLVVTPDLQIQPAWMTRGFPRGEAQTKNPNPWDLGSTFRHDGFFALCADATPRRTHADAGKLASGGLCEGTVS